MVCNPPERSAPTHRSSTATAIVTAALKTGAEPQPVTASNKVNNTLSADPSTSSRAAEAVAEVGKTKMAAGA